MDKPTDRRRAAQYFRGRICGDSIDVGRFEPQRWRCLCGAVRVVWRGLGTTVYVYPAAQTIEGNSFTIISDIIHLKRVPDYHFAGRST